MTIRPPSQYLNGVVDFLLMAHKSDAKFNQLVEAEACDLDKNQNEKNLINQNWIDNLNISTICQYDF